MPKHRKQSAVLKRVGQVGAAAAVVAVPAVMAAPAASATNWDAVAQCESGGNWSTDTGNGFSGGLQFTPSTWKANGGTGSPEGASKSEQIKVAENVKKSQGMSAWPNCGSQGGSSSASSSSDDSSSSSASDDSSSSSSSNDQSSSSVDEDSSSSSSGSASPSLSSEASSGHGNYTVQSGDTLGKIAQKEGSDGWQQLYQLNKDTLQSPNTLFPGQQLETH